MNFIPTIKPFYYLIVIAIFALQGCEQNYELSSHKVNYLSIDSTLTEDSTLKLLSLPYKNALDKTMSEVISISEIYMQKDRPESTLGNLITNLCLQKARKTVEDEIDFCLLNKGGFRSTLPKGEITRGRIFELMPFENELVILKLTGQKTEELFAYIAKKGGCPVSGIEMGIKDTMALNIKINNRPFDPNREYTVLTSDYLANGGDRMYFFRNPLQRKSVGIKLRDAIIEFMLEQQQKNIKISSSLDKRVYVID